MSGGQFFPIRVQRHQANIFGHEKGERRFCAMERYRIERTELGVGQMIVDPLQERRRHRANTFSAKFRRDVSGQTQAIGKSNRAGGNAGQRACARDSLFRVNLFRLRLSLDLLGPRAGMLEGRRVESFGFFRRALLFGNFLFSNP